MGAGSFSREGVNLYGIYRKYGNIGGMEEVSQRAPSRVADPAPISGLRERHVTA